MAHPQLPPNGVFTLYDHDRERVEAVAALLRDTPEARRTGATVEVAHALDAAVAGATCCRNLRSAWRPGLTTTG
jgi:hypothetical protein